MDAGFLTSYIEPVAKWLHIIAGVMWIGLLYFFNFINGHVAATMDADTKKKVVPELIVENRAIGDTKKFLKNLDETETFKTVDYAKLTVLLVDAMKDQQKQINELKTEIQELKNGSS